MVGWAMCAVVAVGVYCAAVWGNLRCERDGTVVAFVLVEVAATFFAVVLSVLAFRVHGRRWWPLTGLLVVLSVGAFACSLWLAKTSFDCI